MKDQIINQETYILAKQKGCDFSEMPYRDSVTFKLVPDKNAEARLEYFSVFDPIEEAAGLCRNPSQSLLQKWLRENHGIVLDVFQESKNRKYTGMWKVDISIIGLYQEQEFPVIPIIDKDFEKAIELGLQEALKKINDINQN